MVLTTPNKKNILNCVMVQWPGTSEEMLTVCILCLWTFVCVFVKQPPMECYAGVKNKDLMCYN